MGEIKQFDSLSTSFVNLAALIRHLRSQEFVGSIHVELPHYEAEVVLSGQGTQTVSEIDPVTRRAAQSEGAMERLLVHAREGGGTITVYEAKPAPGIHDEVQAGTDSPARGDQLPVETVSVTEAIDWDDLLDAAGAVVGAVERAVQSMGQEFDTNFRAARIELGDDYPFLDPTGNGLNYRNRVIALGPKPRSSTFVTGLTECLRRIVNKLAMGKERKRFRETVAVELAVAARMRPGGLAEFKSKLDRIAGTRVL